MTVQERKRIAGILADAIRAQGAIPLHSVPRFIPAGACSRNVGLKKWLENEFPEFFIFGTNGYETLDFSNSALSKFYKLLLNAVPANQPHVQVSIYKIKELIVKSGLNPAQYADAASMQQLLRVYPAYALVEQPEPQYNASAPIAVGEDMKELNFVQAVSYMNWRIAHNKIRCFKVNSALTLNHIRDSIVRRFSKALVDGEGLLLDAINDDPGRVVFSSGYRTDNGQDIYCILQPNADKEKKPEWVFIGAAYPGEQDAAGLGVWLERRFFYQSSVTYKDIQTQIEALERLRAGLLPRVENLVRSLECSVRPVSISADIAEYERRWEELTENLNQLAFPVDEGKLQLPQLRALLEEKNGILDIARNAFSIFDQIHESTAKHFGALGAVVPSSDVETVHNLFAQNEAAGDIRVFQEILEPYSCLKRVLCAQDRNDVLEEISIVAKHFSLSKLLVATILPGEYNEAYSYLESINEIQRILDNCLRTAEIQGNQQVEALDTDALAAEILSSEPSFSHDWLKAYCSLITEDEQVRSAILTLPEGKAEAGAKIFDDFTPSSVAARILNSCGNRERLAERYLLLGLITDRAACVELLLELYRKADDQERFLAVWDSPYRELNYTAEDACYRLAIRCANEVVTREEIEEFIALNPGIKTVRAFRENILAAMFESGEECVAYQRWMGMSELKLNALEKAVIDNDADTVYQHLANPEQMLELGYSESELQTIHQALTEGLTDGTDISAKARRLYQIQKNKNCSAECLLWSVPLTPVSQQMLFAMYSDMGDHSSVCWMTQRFSIATDTPAVAARYALALSELKQHTTLSKLLMDHPELWHKSMLLAELQDAPWPEIYQRETSRPLRPISPFSAALISDNTEEMLRLLDDEEAMEAHGYSAEMVRMLREKFDAGNAPSGTDRLLVIKRFRYYQKNLNRDMEQYLYQQCNVNFNWAAQQLYTLAYAEERYLDALRYFECYPMLQRTDSNICIYLWCLLRLERNQALVEQALLHSGSLRFDRDLAKAILEHSRQNNLTEFADDIQRIIMRLPVNAFEEAVMQSKNAQMLEYISNPDLLTAMGYSKDEIKRFKECISKPFPYGSDGYPLGVRMRMFFDNERALPFLEDAADDPRSAKLLLDIYFSKNQWNLVCDIYRAHLDEGIWNPTFENRYIKALSKSRSPENCRAYLEYLQSDGCEEQNESTYPWKYLRGLIGTGQEEAALAEMDRLVQDGYECTAEMVPETLELGWEIGSAALREQLVLFAARICLKNMSVLSPEQQKAILSINGRLTSSDDSQYWITLLEKNGLQKVSALLKCYFKYGIGDDTQSLYAAGETLMELLADPQESGINGLLPAVTTFALSNDLLEGETSEQYKGLLSIWLKEAFTRGDDTQALGLETMGAAEFREFLSLWQAVTPTDEQLSMVFSACFCEADSNAQRTAQFFQRFAPLLERLSGDPRYEKKYAAVLMSAFSRWLIGVDETQRESIQIAAAFLRSAVYNAEQLSDLIECCKEQPCLYVTLIRDAVFFRCENTWPDVLYHYLQNQYYCPGLEERQHEAISRAQLLLHVNEIEPGTDNQSLQFAYNLICNNPSPSGLKLLHQLYRKADKNNQADILYNLEAVCHDDMDVTAISAWFHKLLDTHSVEGIEYYSRWWAPLVLLQETDNQTRSILPYLTADETSMQYKGSVLRLLLSDLFNDAYISCYLRLAPEITPTVWGKLAYIRAAHNPTVCDSTIRECIAMKQYLHAVTLLTNQISPAPTTAVFIGQTLAEIYTAESLQVCPELTAHIPNVFRYIMSLNKEDPIGAWKNIGRAVDIAILAEREDLFLDLFDREVYVSYAGKCAALIASMMLRGEFTMAERYLKEYYAVSPNDPFSYMALISSVIEDCLNTGKLSAENEILLRSIPVNGNMRPLEMYSALICQAVQDNRLPDCARAFYRLRAFTSKDKALLAGCIHLYTAISEEMSVEKFYDVGLEYLSVVQDAMVSRALQVLAVIAACIPNKVDYRQLVSDCSIRSYNETHDTMWKLYELWQKCTQFLDDAPGDDERRMFLIRAATGWWKIDKNAISFFALYPELCAMLPDIYTTSFYSACIAAVLQNPGDNFVQTTIQAIFNTRGYTWGQEQVNAAAQYPAEVTDRIVHLLDAPMDMPGLYAQFLARVMAEPDEEQFVRQMTMLLVVQKNYTLKQYEDNVCNLKELSENNSSSRQLQVLRILRRKNRAIGQIGHPDLYLNDGDYEMMVIAAERRCENIDPAKPYNKMIYSAYIDLGEFMFEQTASKTYTLTQLINMTTILCQSDRYRDLDKLMDVCPAKWKLCLRAVQELIQGNPRNVLLLMANADFRSHQGCYKMVRCMLNSCLKNERWRIAVQQEGLVCLDMVPTNAWNKNLIRPRRNPAVLDSFVEYMEVQLQQMNKDDSKDENPSVDNEAETINAGGENASFDEHIWKIPFVAECLEQYRENNSEDSDAEESDTMEADETESAGVAREKKEALYRALEEQPGDADTIRNGSALLSLLRQEPVNRETVELCVKLGLARYRESLVRKRSAEFVTERSREILYSMAYFSDVLREMPSMSATIKFYVQQCLTSYQSLSELSGDCASDDLLKLCEIIAVEDKGAAEAVSRHIHFVREIGRKMRDHMTNHEREKWLQQCSADCRNIENPVETEFKNSLADILDQEICVFRNKAHLEIHVYNTECAVGHGCIFGEVVNFGGENVDNLLLSLYIDNLFVDQYSLASLESRDNVPFALPVVCDEPRELSYKLTLKYTPRDGAEEQAPAVEGTLVVREMEYTRARRYDASNPADSDNYVERATVTATLESNYLVEGGLRRFPNLFIYGMKRSGKSSILRRLSRLFDDNYPDDIKHVIVSCEGLEGDFYTRVHTAFVNYVLDELNYKFDLESQDGWQEFCEKWEEVPEQISDFRWVDRFYTALTHHWMPGQGLVILIDEIERLYYELEAKNGHHEDEDVEQPEVIESSIVQSRLWDVLNKMTQRDNSAVRFVLCGSDFFTSKLIAEGDNLTQFFQKGVKLNVDRMEEREICEALRANGSLTIPDETLRYLWDIAGGMPWHSKVFCNSVIEHELKQEEHTRTTLYPSDIQSAIDHTLSSTKDIASHANFGLLSLSKEENLIIQVAARVLDSRLRTISFEALMELVCQESGSCKDREIYDKALRSLVNERKLLRVDSGWNYQFSRELCRLYLREERPIRFMK